MKKQYLAFDLGASSGRAIIGSLDNGKISLEEIHRFPNSPVEINGGLFWDTLGLFSELKTGLAKAVQSGADIAGIAIDTWGVDYALLDKNGFLAGQPRNYRDPRTDDAMPLAFKKMPSEKIYAATGIQFMTLNTIFQLVASLRDNDASLEIADKLLFTPNILTYFFCGDISAEYSIATTSQLYNPSTKDWAWEVIDAMGIKRSLFPGIKPSGTIVGTVRPAIQNELKCGAIPVILVGAHDTASAVAAVPARKGSSWAYLSSGTWSLLGLELDKPLLTDDARKANYTNEGGVGGKIRFLKNIMGLWLIQECRNEWKRQGTEYSFGQMVELAKGAEPLRSFVDPNAQEFVAPGDMPGRIADYCRRTGQPVPETHGQIIRTAYESLAMRYRKTITELEKLACVRLDVLHLVGGGCQNLMLNQFTADATGLKVLTGPIEATAMGNIAVQAMATGDIHGLDEAREIVAVSTELGTYLPEDKAAWDAAFPRFAAVEA